MQIMDLTSLTVTSVAVLIGSWVLLFLLCYFLTPYYIRYGDQRSRAIYSAVYSLPFAIIICLGFGVMPQVNQVYGFWPTIIVALIFVLLLTLFQNYVVSELMKRKVLKMEKK